MDLKKVQIFKKQMQADFGSNGSLATNA